eukprot:9813573-Alexandrium_andersonii.AAC.1
MLIPRPLGSMMQATMLAACPLSSTLPLYRRVPVILRAIDAHCVTVLLSPAFFGRKESGRGAVSERPKHMPTTVIRYPVWSRCVANATV